MAGRESESHRQAAFSTYRNPRKFTCSSMRDAWGALNHRRGWGGVGGIRDLANILRLYYKVERPTYEQLKLVGMAIAQSAGLTVFSRPNAFDIDDPSGFAQSEISRMMLGIKSCLVGRNTIGRNSQEIASVHPPLKWLVCRGPYGRGRS